MATLPRTDKYHLPCVDVARRIDPPLLTSWPVVTEAAWLSRARQTALDHLWELIEDGALAVLELGLEAAPKLRRVLKRYRSLRPKLADAKLVYLAEREETEIIFTLDRRDFSVYRTTRGRAFHLIPDVQ